MKPLVFLKSARLAKHMTQAQLASRVGVDASHISRLEGGHSKGVSMEVVQAVARELGVTVSYLFGEEAREAAKEYGENHPARAILSDYHAPQGLRDLAADKALADALRITADEWRSLLSLEHTTEISKDGYVQLLVTIRAISKPAGYHVAQP